MTKVGVYVFAMGAGIGTVALLCATGYNPGPLYSGLISGGLCFTVLTLFRKTILV